MKYLCYPAVFTKEKEGYSITFPDLEGCFTEADTLQEGYQMAEDCLNLYFEGFDFKNNKPPNNSYLTIINNLKEDQFVFMISNMRSITAYIKNIENKNKERN